jgi:predicted metal-dependent hydrolase
VLHFTHFDVRKRQIWPPSGRDILPIMSDLIRSSTKQLPEKVIAGIAAFNAGDYFEAHELLEDAWLAEPDEIRDLYRGILQIAVCYFHLTRRNYEGAQKMYGRSQKWLTKWQPSCRGVRITQLLRDAENVIQTVTELGPDRISEFKLSSLRPIQMDEAFIEKE